MARLQRGGPGIIIQDQRGPEPRSPDAHLHAEVEQPRVAVPHAELAQQRRHHLLSAGAPRHRQRLVLDVRSEATRVHFYRRLWTREFTMSERILKSKRRFGNFKHR